VFDERVIFEKQNETERNEITWNCTFLTKLANKIAKLDIVASKLITCAPLPPKKESYICLRRGRLENFSGCAALPPPSNPSTAFKPVGLFDPKFS
jgi:hypothetical protein